MVSSNVPVVTADVAVVGAGPAGAATAITLARAGRDVVLVDRATFPRDKCCGDGLTAGALRRLEQLGLDAPALPSWQAVHDVVVRSCSGRTVTFPLPRTGVYGAVVRRMELDAALVDVARAAGVKVFDGHALVAASAGGAAVDLAVTGLGTIRASFAVGADGMWSPLRKAVAHDAERGDTGRGDDERGGTGRGTVGEAPGANGGGGGDGGYLGEWHAFRQYFRNVGPEAASRLWVWFEADLLPAYAWSFPLPGNRANVGFGVLRKRDVPTSSMKAMWPELLRRPAIAEVLGRDAVAEAPHKAWPIPARVDRTELAAAGGRVLFVGDAARAPDPMTGEGIGQALDTGVLAAEAILAAGPGAPARAAARYEMRVRSTLAVDTRLARFLSEKVLAHRKGVRAAVAVAGLTPWTRRNFARWLFEDYPRAVLATPHRWHRGMLAGPGAYQPTG